MEVISGEEDVERGAYEADGACPYSPLSSRSIGDTQHCNVTSVSRGTIIVATGCAACCCCCSCCPASPG